MSRVRNAVLSAVVLVLGRGRAERRRRRGADGERLVAPGPESPRSEAVVVFLLLVAALFATAFPVIYALDRIPRQTQFLGLSLGLAFAFLAAALLVMARRVVPDEELEEEYPQPSPEEQDEVVAIVEQSGERITRRRLLGMAGGAAGVALGAALVTPAVSLGPIKGLQSLYDTPWRPGRRLVDVHGRPLLIDDIEPDVFYTAFPRGAARDRVGSPLIVVRLDPTLLRLPDGREDWAPEGVVAYSKICTHAGCAVSQYRAPLFDPVEPEPALICPCHYSTFNPATGGTVDFGPAGRPLPQLPLDIGPAGELFAGGNFSEAPGPSWWGVRLEEPE